MRLLNSFCIFQIGQKYFFFPGPQGSTPDPVKWNRNRKDCEALGAQMAVPENDEEGAAVEVKI